MATKYTEHLDPAKGELVFDAAARAPAAGDPDTEIIVAVLRTPLGTAARDMTYGIDLDDIDFGAPNAAAVVRQRIERALARWTQRGDFIVDDIEVERAPDGYFARVTHRRAGSKPATTPRTALGR